MSEELGLARATLAEHLSRIESIVMDDLLGSFSNIRINYDDYSMLKEMVESDSETLGYSTDNNFKKLLTNMHTNMNLEKIKTDIITYQEVCNVLESVGLAKNYISKEILKNYLETSQGDIKDTKQLRLVITSLSNESLGFIDLFDFDAQNNRAGVSIVITAAHRNKGFGKDALKVLMEHSFKTLALHQLYSNILEENTASLRLFESVGFQNIGQKKEWRFFNGSYKNEYLLQYINHVL